MLYGSKTWGTLITLNCSGSAAFTMHAMDAMCEDWCQWVWPSWRWPIYMREDNDSNVLVMITLLIWTTWTLMPKRLLQTQLICITCNAMSQLWSSWYVVSPRTMSAHKISCRGCSLMSWRIRYSAPASQMTRPCRTWWWLAEEIQKLYPRGGHGHGHPKKTWPEETHMDCLELGLTKSHPSNGKELGVVNLEVSSHCTHPTLGTN